MKPVLPASKHADHRPVALPKRRLLADPAAGETLGDAASGDDLRRAGARQAPGRSAAPAAAAAANARPMPRMTTLAGLPLPRFGRLISTTNSFASSGRPSAPIATSGWLSTIGRLLPLDPALHLASAEPSRMTTTFSREPVSTRRLPQPLGQHQGGGENEDDQRHAGGGQGRGQPAACRGCAGVGKRDRHLADPPQALGDPHRAPRQAGKIAATTPTTRAATSCMSTVAGATREGGKKLA